MFISKFLEFNTKRYLRKNEVDRKTIGFRKAQKIGIIFSAEGIEKHHAIKSLIKDLKEEGKEVAVLSFLGKGKQNHEFLFDIITVNDIGFWGSIQNENILKFAEEPFDYLFHLDTTDNRILDNILAMSKAKCRVGLFKEGRGSYFELMINPKDPASSEELIHDIYHYTKTITVNDK
jgi:hypothetical protein